MTQEDKELLLKDLCARLPYGVKAHIKNWSKLDRKYYEGVYTIESVHPSLNDIYATTENGSVEVILGYSDYFIKPYLFPLSSMTEEHNKKLKVMCDWHDVEEDAQSILVLYHKHFVMKSDVIDWLNENHIDYRGLIEKGLAIDATGLNVY